MSSGRVTTNISLESANQPGEHRSRNDEGSRQQDAESPAERAIVRRPSRNPGGPARLELRILLGLQWHAPHQRERFGEDPAVIAEGSEKQVT